MVYGMIGSPTLMDRVSEPEANARLIAAAPDLLAALERMLNAHDADEEHGILTGNTAAADQARTAIALAKGQS
jgi:hypothetical protein